MLIRGAKGIPQSIAIPATTMLEMRLCTTIFKDISPSRNALFQRAMTFYTNYLSKANEECVAKEKNLLIQASKSNPTKPRRSGMKYRKRGSNGRFIEKTTTTP